MTSNKNKQLWVLLLLAVSAVAVLRFLPISDWMHQLQVQIERLGSFAPIGYVLVYVVTTVFMIPGSLLTIGAGGLFGLWLGFAVVVVGANIGALCAFVLAKTFLRKRVARWAEGNPKFAAIDRAIGRDGFKMVLLLRLSPAFPFSLLNYLLGLTTVKTGEYVLANLIGMLPATFMIVYIAATARDALSAGSNLGLLQVALRVLGILATIAVVVMVTRTARKALAQVEQETAGENDANHNA